MDHTCRTLGPWNLRIRHNHTESTVNAISCIVKSFNVISSSDKRVNENYKSWPF